MAAQAGGFRSRAAAAEAMQQITAGFQIRRIRLGPCRAVPPGHIQGRNPAAMSRDRLSASVASRVNLAVYDSGATSVPSDPTAIPTDLHWLTIADAARLIERRRLSPVELTDALIARIQALDPQINAFLLPTPEKAREQARTAEREIMEGNYRSPLHGVPFG